MRTSKLNISQLNATELTLLTGPITGIIKRLLDALKAETISESTLPHFLSSFESLIKCNYNAEVHRSLALFVTLFVTVFANLRMSTKLSFSQSSLVYISKTLMPSFFLVSSGDELPDVVSRVGRLRTGVADRLLADPGLGVLETDGEGVWKA